MTSEIRGKNLTAWDWLYAHWLPHSCYSYAGENTHTHQTAYFEEYLIKHGHPYRLKLYLPVTRSEVFNKLRIEPLTCRILACSAVGPDAQNRAGRMLIDCLRERYPYLLQNTERFLVSESDPVCTCGVFCGDEIDHVTHPLHLIDLRVKSCIRMELSGGCDPERVERILSEWAYENGFVSAESPDEQFFMAYHIDSNRADAYLPVK